MKMIVAADKNWGIGKNGGLLVHIPGDLKFFKETTLGSVVVMGRKTFESFPGKKALPGRTNIVLTANPDWTAENTIVVHSHEELQKKLQEYDTNNIFIIGGGQLYHAYVDQCDAVYVTHIDGEYDADTWFPHLDEHSYEIKEVLREETSNDVSYKICLWEK